ncbi:MAG: helix-turn-helix domain-containing protein [Bacillota bacterium]
MDFIRIGDKVISRQKIDEVISTILAARTRGLSQSEVAAKTGIDRTFISRLESLGEVRKGSSMAVIGFPLSNCDEIRRVCQEEGVDYTLLMTDEERWQFVRDRSGNELLNELMGLVAKVRQFAKVVLIGSDKRLEILKGVMDKNTDIAAIVIGRSPMSGDVYLNPETLRRTIRGMKG